MRRVDGIASACGRPQRRTSDDEPRTVLAHLLTTVSAAVRRLERAAVHTQSDRDVSRWSAARQCARELAIVSEALGASPVGPLATRSPSDDPLATMLGAYDRTLRVGVPRAVRAVLEEHRLALLSIGSISQAA